MYIFQPNGALAGFHADLSKVDEIGRSLVHLGEQWLAPDRQIGIHDHTVWELYLQLEGHTSWHSPDGRIDLGPQDFLAMPPQARHGMAERPDSRHHFFFAGVDVPRVLADLPELARHWPEAGVIRRRNATSLRAPFRQLVREVRMDLAYRSQGIAAALRLLIIECCRLLADTPERAHAALHPAVEEARRLIDHDPTEAWKLADLGALVGLSPNHLANIFKKEIGVAPHQYLLKQRIERAKDLLRDSDLAITQIALELGFASSQHFARVFTRLIGCSASSWRSSHR